MFLHVDSAELLTPRNLYDYQKDAILHMLYHPNAMLWAGIGLGKTIMTLTTIVERMRNNEVSKVLIFGPLRVVESVWNSQATEWSHTNNLTFNILHGSPQKRLRSLFSKADIYMCNYENMNWLAKTLDRYFLEQSKPLPFEMVVYDEISWLKNSTSTRIQGGIRESKNKYNQTVKVKVTGWRKIIPHFKYRIGLTGSPASNGYLDLFGQYLVLDNGERLGQYVTNFKKNYFMSDYNGWKYTPTDSGKKFIESRISDITKEMNTKDYLDLPPVKTQDVFIDLPANARRIYDELEREFFTLLDSGVEIEVFSKGTVSGKCLQVCNGALYRYDENDNSKYESIHDAKLDALEEVLIEANGNPVLCIYRYQHDVERIMKRFKKYKLVNLSGAPASNTKSIIDKWNNGNIELLLGHPRSMAHGIDGLQKSGHIIVWMGMNYSLDLTEQALGRLDRQGQKHPISEIRIHAANTLDLAVIDSLKNKDETQERLKSSIMRYRCGLLS